MAEEFAQGGQKHGAFFFAQRRFRVPIAQPLDLFCGSSYKVHSTPLPSSGSISPFLLFDIFRLERRFRLKSLLFNGEADFTSMLTLLLALSVAAKRPFSRKQGLNATAVHLPKAWRKPGARPLDFVDCFGRPIDLNDPDHINWWDFGFCCAEDSSEPACPPNVRVVCQTALDGGDTYTPPMTVDQAWAVCVGYCSWTPQPGWCRSLDGEDDEERELLEKFTECFGENPATATRTDYEKLGKCCGVVPDYSNCEGLPAGCDAFYKGETTELGELTIEEIEATCDAYCDALEKKLDSCPSGLSGGAIAGIVVASVVVVGATVGGLVYFFVIRKPVPVGKA